MSGMHLRTALVEPSGYTCLRLRRKLKAVLGYDPILNKVGEGYKIREESDQMKRMSLQWRLTCITTLCIAIICGCLTMFVYKNGVYYMDSLQEAVDAQGR